MPKRKRKARWQVLEVVQEWSAEAADVDVDSYARLLARILEQQASSGAKTRDVPTPLRQRQQ